MSIKEKLMDVEAQFCSEICEQEHESSIIMAWLGESDVLSTSNN